MVLAILLPLAAVLVIAGTWLIATSRTRRPATQRATVYRAGQIGDEAERWLRAQTPQGAGDAKGRRTYFSAARFEGTGPFLWPAAYLAVIGGLFFLASLYNPGELADMTVVVPLALSLTTVVAGYLHRRRRRRRIEARGDVGGDVVQRLLDRQRRGDGGH